MPPPRLRLIYNVCMNWLGLGLVALAALGCNGKSTVGSSATGTASSVQASASPSSVKSAKPSAQAGLSAEQRKGLQGRIVFVSERDGNREVYWMRPDGSQLTRLTNDPGQDYPAEVCGTPDKLLLVHAAGEHQHDHVEQLALADWQLSANSAKPAKQAAQPFGPPAKMIRNPSCHPDGKQWIVESSLDGFRDLYRFSIDNAKPERLTDDPKGSFEPHVHPRGEAVVFVSSREADPEIYRFDLGGSGKADVKRLTWSRGDDSNPRWSPDGSRIAFVSSRNGMPRIFLMQANGSKPMPLIAEEGQDAGVVEDVAPRWSPDGAHIVYGRKRQEGVAIRIVRVSDGVVVHDTTTTEGRRVDEMPSWSPDGKFVIFASNRAERHPDIYIMRPDGRDLTRLTRARGADWLPRWVAMPR